jgi:hypothetical protein
VSGTFSPQTTWRFPIESMAIRGDSDWRPGERETFSTPAAGSLRIAKKARKTNRQKIVLGRNFIFNSALYIAGSREVLSRQAVKLHLGDVSLTGRTAREYNARDPVEVSPGILR